MSLFTKIFTKMGKAIDKRTVMEVLFIIETENKNFKWKPSKVSIIGNVLIGGVICAYVCVYNTHIHSLYLNNAKCYILNWLYNQIPMLLFIFCLLKLSKFCSLTVLFKWKSPCFLFLYILGTNCLIFLSSS